MYRMSLSIPSATSVTGYYVVLCLIRGDISRVEVTCHSV